jgi:DNA-binding transcriptional LysR family regulator
LHLELDETTLTSVSIVDDPIDSVMIAEDHPLAQKQWLQAKDLSGHQFIFMPRLRNPVLYDAVLRALVEAGVIANTSGSYSGPRVMWGALSVTDGWTVASRSLAAKPPRGIVVRPLEGFSLPWGVRLAWRRDETDTAVQKVLDIFRTTA